MPILELCGERQRLLDTNGHLLVTGGPGCGKTTISLVKAQSWIKNGQLGPTQRVLFLSFARSTVARVIDSARELIKADDRQSLEINTYHGFCWNILRSHGYLLLPRRVPALLPPADAAAKLSKLSEEQRAMEIRRLAHGEGVVSFDLFAELTTLILRQAPKLRAIISRSYPLILVDEFQDTNPPEWELVKQLGEQSTIIALADPEQRIYDFRDADPERIEHYATYFRPAKFDFGNENRRSAGTDIVQFGNDLLTGANKQRAYQHVSISQYGFYQGRSDAFFLKVSLIQAMRRLLNSSAKKEWSIAVLVPSKRLMLAASDCLSRAEHQLPTIKHEVALDHEGPALAAVAIAGLLGADGTRDQVVRRFLSDVVNHARGRRGTKGPTQEDARIADGLEQYLQTGNPKGARRVKIVSEVLGMVERRLLARLSGDPGKDWLLIREFLASAKDGLLTQIAEDARYLRLLNKGTRLRESLSEAWREQGGYPGARAAVEAAIVEDHFTAAARDYRGVHLMTMHKSKGKQFTEVIIFEGRHQGRIVQDKATDRERRQSLYTLRVAVTRAEIHATILTPKGDICPFL